MLRQFEDQAREAGSTSIRLMIMPPWGESKRTAISFFEKHGYESDIDLGLGQFYVKRL